MEQQGIRQGWVLAPLLFNIIFAAFINVAYARFKADKGRSGTPQEENRGGGRGGATDGESSLVALL